jgi:fatty acid desaturase/predicted heme/steroid binding protein
VTMCKLQNEVFLREGIGGKAVVSELVYIPTISRCGETSTGLSQSLVFTRAEIAAKTVEGKIWIIVHNNVYDVTMFMDEHPGGNLVLQHMAGKDATDAFENYHRDNVAKYMLPRYHIGTVQDPLPVPAHVQDFRELKQEFLRRGMFEVAPDYYNRLYVWLASIFVASLYCTLACSTFAMHMLGACFMGLFWQQHAGLAHDTGHTTVSKSFRGDHRAGSIAGSIVSGISISWWKNSHNTHHVVPNSVENDPDIQHMPFLAISEAVVEKPYWSTYYDKEFVVSRLTALVLSYQHYFFLPLMAFGRFNLYASGIAHLLSDKCKSPYRHTELICILGIFPLWIGALVSTLPNLATMVAWILVSHAVTMVLHLQIVVSHWTMETYRNESKQHLPEVDKKQPKDLGIYGSDDWYILQYRTTLDIACLAWLDWVHIGLQFQTIHHLFPNMPRPHFRAATAMVKEVCHKHGIRHNEMGFFSLIGCALKVLEETAALARTGKYTRNHLAEALRAEG